MIISTIIGARVVSEKAFQRQAGTSQVTRIRVVSNPSRKNDRNPGRFVNVEAWGGLGDQLAKLSKGDLVTVSGELKVDKYESKGEQRQDDSLTCTNFQVHTSTTFFEKGPAKADPDPEPDASDDSDLPY